MCGVVGLLSPEPVAQSLYYGLSMIQHRGQDAAGITTADEPGVHTCKGAGLVRDVLQPEELVRLVGSLGIGHVRYPTNGSQSDDESQPFYVNSPYGLSLVHNGNLTNTDSLRQVLVDENLRHLNTQSDSEVLLNVIAYELSQVVTGTLQPTHLFQALKKVYERIDGAFSCLLLIHGCGLVAFRDPMGIRPLIYGEKTTDAGTAHLFASESIVIDSLEYSNSRDVKPGEAVYVDLKGGVFSEFCVEARGAAPCLFEYVYLSRDDSIIDGASVYATRQNMGSALGELVAQSGIDDIDVVIPVPDTGRPSAQALARTISTNYCEGFVKNRYIGRTFIMPGQAVRKESISLKLNAIRQEFEGKTVLLVDDSIVRGNTSQKIVALARKAGAKKVYFASAAPAVRHPNVYGIDMPNAEELVAAGRTTDEVAEQIGADRLFYLPLDSLKKAVNLALPDHIPPFESFEDSIFTGKYRVGGIDAAYLKRLADARG